MVSKLAHVIIIGYALYKALEVFANSGWCTRLCSCMHDRISHKLFKYGCIDGWQGDDQCMCEAFDG